MRAFSRAFGDPRWQRIVAVTAAQGGKTDTILDIMGERLDNRPAPILYVGPSKEFLTDQFEPRLTTMFAQSTSLRDKVLGGLAGKRQKKTLKRIAGVRVRLAHAGSSTALKSDPAAIALVDEYDEMLANIRGQGDPLGLIEARGTSYADFQTGVTSTPSIGAVEIVTDAASGLEFWALADADDIGSPIWRLWQEGTRHHYCWPCPHCGEFFVPRFRQLKWPKNATAAQAAREAWVECPRCEGRIEERHKAAMNARGAYVAPGEVIDRDGNVTGAAADTTTLSLWASGLCTPLVTFGARAEAYLKALATGESAKIQTAFNAGFGELYLPGGGGVLEWQEVKSRADGRASGEVPAEAIFLVAGVDVQGNRLPYVIRAFGPQATSWLIEHGELWGRTSQEDVWRQLGEKLAERFDGMPVKVAFVDAGFRPGKKDQLPVHRVYEFCRDYRRFVVPTIGSATRMQRPLIMTAIEVEPPTGKGAKFGLQRARLDTDYFKALVHERLGFSGDQPGALHMSADVTDDYCQQLVAEARVRTPSGKWTWVKRARDNHFLDCEAMAAAAAFRLNAETLKATARPRPDRKGAAPAPPPPAASLKSRFADLSGRINR